MTERIGLRLNGARGPVAATAVSGLLAPRTGLVPPTGCVTELLDADLPRWDAFVVGGHDTATTPPAKRVESPAAPLVLDPARPMAAAHAAGRVGAQGAPAFFVEDPWGSDEHRLAEQTRELHESARSLA